MKKLVSFMLVAAMVAATLTGCGSSDNAKSTEAAGESSAAAGTTFKIGGIGCDRRCCSVRSGSTAWCSDCC